MNNAEREERERLYVQREEREIHVKMKEN